MLPSPRQGPAPSVEQALDPGGPHNAHLFGMTPAPPKNTLHTWFPQ